MLEVGTRKQYNNPYRGTPKIYYNTMARNRLLPLLGFYDYNVQ